MPRPIIKLQKDRLDQMLEGIAILFVLVMVCLPLVAFQELPETIPTHFNASGEADGYGSRYTLLILPVIGSLMFAGLLVLNKYPHVFNYPEEITEANAAKHYRNGTKLIRWINLIIVVSFSFIEWRVIRSASQGQGSLGPYFLPVFLTAIFGVIALYFWKSRREA